MMPGTHRLRARTVFSSQKIKAKKSAVHHFFQNISLSPVASPTDVSHTSKRIHRKRIVTRTKKREKKTQIA
jgi:hypothetical protein